MISGKIKQMFFTLPGDGLQDQGPLSSLYSGMCSSAWHRVGAQECLRMNRRLTYFPSLLGRSFFKPVKTEGAL